MSWDHQLSSILSAADGSVAKMRERLASTGKYARTTDDQYLMRDTYPTRSSVLSSALPQRDPCAGVSLGVEWTDLASIKHQLLMQNREIESLTQKVNRMEIEKRCQECHIQNLRDEVCNLREELKDLERDPSQGRKMDQWRREIGIELCGLRDEMTRNASIGEMEESLSAKLQREGLENVCEEVDQMKKRLRRQEENMHLQQTEVREARRQYDRSCRLLEELSDGYRTHSSDMVKGVSQFSCIQRDLYQLRTTVTDLKDEVRCLKIRGRELESSQLGEKGAPNGKNGAQKTSAGSLSETLSLAEISTDDPSLLEDKTGGSKLSDITGPGSDGTGGVSLSDSANQKSVSELSVKDL